MINPKKDKAIEKNDETIDETEVLIEAKGKSKKQKKEKKNNKKNKKDAGYYIFADNVESVKDLFDKAKKNTPYVSAGDPECYVGFEYKENI